MTDNQPTVGKLARLFYDQCVGEFNGHMAAVPHNPLFASIFKAAGWNGGERSFSNILRQIADDLDKEAENAPF